MTSERSLSVIGYACLVGKVIACPQVLQVVGGLGGPRDCAERKPWRKRLAPAIVIDVRVIFVMFSVEERERVRARLVQASREDDRLVAGALIGSTARGGGDQWSDLDLTFGLAENASMDDVMADWKARLENEFGAVHLFDLPHLSTTYRVFLLPNNLQVDLSFTPGNKFLVKGLKYDLLFGNALEREQVRSSPEQFFGLAVVYLLHAHACIARGRMWEAEYCISAARDQALMLACLHRSLKTSYGRGFDDLPREILQPVTGALVGSLEKTELIQALGRSIEVLLQNSQDVSGLAGRLGPQLRELKSYQ